MSKLRYTITYEVDKETLCDDETIKNDFNNSWQEFLDWFAEEEPGEVITGLDTLPVEIKVAQPHNKEVRLWQTNKL